MCVSRPPPSRRFQRGQRIAAHARSSLKGRHTTVTERMPIAHREYAGWSPARLAECTNSANHRKKSG